MSIFITQNKKDLRFDFKFDESIELWFWHCSNGKHSESGFEEKKDCINDAIINGYENNQK